MSDKKMRLPDLDELRRLLEKMERDLDGLRQIQRDAFKTYQAVQHLQPRPPDYRIQHETSSVPLVSLRARNRRETCARRLPRFERRVDAWSFWGGLLVSLPSNTSIPTLTATFSSPGPISHDEPPSGRLAASCDR